MTTKPRQTFDPAVLAASVRDVAVEARRILKDSAHAPYELRALTRRIHQLQGQFPVSSNTDLSRWLKSLSRVVESHPSRIQRTPHRRLDLNADVRLN